MSTHYADNGSPSPDMSWWPLIAKVPAHRPFAELAAHEVFLLIKQAVFEATLDANKQANSHKADFVRQQLLGG